MSTAWVTVRYGSLAEVGVLRAVLEANGIPTNVPEETLGTMDPFMRGRGTVFDYTLQVPAPCVGEARPLLEAEEPGVEPAYSEEVGPREVDSPGEPSSARAEPGELGARLRRARWASLYGLTAPYTLWVVLGAIWHASYWQRSPRERALDAGALVLATLETAALLALIGAYVGSLVRAS